MALSNGISLSQKGGLSQGIPLTNPAPKKAAPTKKAPVNTPAPVDPNLGSVPIGGYNPAQMAMAKSKGTPASRALG